MIKINLLVLPEIMPSALTGAWDVLTSVDKIAETFSTCKKAKAGFELNVVSNNRDEIKWPNGISIKPRFTIDDAPQPDLLYIPTVNVPIRQQHDDISDWIRHYKNEGAIICSACTGAFMLGDAGILNHQKATTHWAYADQFITEFPEVNVQKERMIVTTGVGDQIVTTGGSYGAWQIMMLYLTERFFGRELATQIGKVYLMDWDTEKQSPYAAINFNLTHSDAAIKHSQKWLGDHFEHPNANDLAIEQSGLTARTYNRRFKAATGVTPLNYLQNLRIEAARKLLEQTSKPIDVISTEIGYFDPSHFRQLFKRSMGITPSEYRRKFQIPGQLQ